MCSLPNSAAPMLFRPATTIEALPRMRRLSSPALPSAESRKSSLPRKCSGSRAERCNSHRFASRALKWRSAPVFTAANGVAKSGTVPLWPANAVMCPVSFMSSRKEFIQCCLESVYVGISIGVLGGNDLERSSGDQLCHDGRHRNRVHIVALVGDNQRRQCESRHLLPSHSGSLRWNSTEKRHGGCGFTSKEAPHRRRIVRRFLHHQPISLGSLQALQALLRAVLRQ